ncbi:aspartate--ammonia ligase [Oceanispirochaeta sp.]|jgi:aspartate--ammonia ligase|uniref:aspartate--ammonia ligase n=1 Tax=Oceanispirochaeta sp. TaxID=2035350 RepID=UPI00260CAF6F|nr:aspartate--ammonia ligase [Oceanispirochaeta sp.]MDA3955698.1 aspartate--ammonia ligase [Oceanispirochaeta sp.]
MSAEYYYPEGYKSLLSLEETEKAIADIKMFFQTYFSAQLRLRRVTAPLFIEAGTGINDDLNGIEKPVSFKPKGMGCYAEIPQSLAKWKRMMLGDYNIDLGYGLYTDMNAIRPDEDPDNLHSYYVDQWDWEKAISSSDRTLAYLKSMVKKIYATLKATEFMVFESFPEIKPILPESITFIHAEELCRQYPDLTPVERESKAASQYGAVFIIGIGAALSDGNAHDGRAPDYDDWSSENEDGYKGLNGDIILWNPILNRTFEISSMGIRVDREALLRQMHLRDAEDRKDLLFHKRLLSGDFPESIGGGIGQSRLCMFLLRKAHVGEVQASLWPEEIRRDCTAKGIKLM